MCLGAMIKHYLKHKIKALRHGWVVDEHIKNSPQVVMKRRVGYVDKKPDLVRAIWASPPGC